MYCRFNFMESCVERELSFICSLRKRKEIYIPQLEEKFFSLVVEISYGPKDISSKVIKIVLCNGVLFQWICLIMFE